MYAPETATYPWLVIVPFFGLSTNQAAPSRSVGSLPTVSAVESAAYSCGPCWESLTSCTCSIRSSSGLRKVSDVTSKPAGQEIGAMGNGWQVVEPSPVLCAFTVKAYVSLLIIVPVSVALPMLLSPVTFQKPSRFSTVLLFPNASNGKELSRYSVLLGSPKAGSCPSTGIPPIVSGDGSPKDTVATEFDSATSFALSTPISSSPRYPV